ncbi:MAG: hypothetical protein AAF791_08880 [Bacteroidota bacterium]
MLKLTLLSALLVAAPAAAQFQVERAAIVSGVTGASGGSFQVRGVAGLPAVGMTMGGSFTICHGIYCAVQAETGGATLEVSLVVALAGVYDTGTSSMRTVLDRDGLLPLAQPYADPFYDGTPLDYDGAEVTTPSVLDQNDVVDWVLVEVRTAAQSESVGKAAALLLSDGTVLNASGTGGLVFDGITTGSYFVVVRHRNHLDAMTAAAHDFSASGAPPDLTASGATFGSGGTIEVETGVWALVPGDGDADGSVLAADETGVWEPQVGQVGYLPGDFGLDGWVLADDRQVLWLPSLGDQSGVPTPSNRIPNERQAPEAQARVDRSPEAPRRLPARRQMQRPPDRLPSP